MSEEPGDGAAGPTPNFETITLDVDARLAHITLRRPQALNSLSPQMMIELRDAFDIVAASPDVRALLLSGEGRAFCAGADLSQAGPATGSAPPRDVGLVVEDYVNPLVRRLAALEKPVVTAVQGAAAGAGCSLALQSDFVLVGRSAYFLQAFIHVGLIPDGGATWMLPRLVGLGRATTMMMLGERIKAEQAVEWGLATQIFDDAALIDAARDLGRRLAAGPTQALGLMRRAIRAGLSTDLATSMQLERTLQREAGFTSDYAEGVRAFKAGERPIFTGA